VLGYYVREAGLLRLEEAVRKMTSLPLRRFNIQDRGVLREGMRADITVFDASTIQDNSTYLSPAQSPSGIEYVVVNGQVTVQHGKLDASSLAGRVLRR
jgi:dihydroorotase/N-acyl-D-amino-acid deacylase